MNNPTFTDSGTPIRTAVLCGNREEYNRFLEIHEKYNFDNTVFVSYKDKIVGSEIYDFVIYGTFMSREDRVEIWDEVIFRIHRTIKDRLFEYE